MCDINLYEAGMRDSDGRYYKFVSSKNRDEVIDFIEIMKEIKREEFEIIFYEKCYRLISTTPSIINT